MSSPLSNLKKATKSPLINATRCAPFKPVATSEDDLISQLNLERKMNTLQSSSQKNECVSNTSLMSAMVTRLSCVEKKLAEYENDLREKDKKIHVLQEKCDLYKKAQGYGSDQVAELERKCHKLQKQVHCMENFLEDYGMIWVGNPNSSDEEDEEEEDQEVDCDEHARPVALYAQDRLWKPDQSVSTPGSFEMNFDLVLHNINELNTIAGEGEHVIQHTKDGARLQIKEPVPLILYSNGIFMFGGPFRPYGDPVTQICMQDLMDGYFPSELQQLYPDGVPFNVTDKRDVVFRDKRLETLFPGQGQMLSPEKVKQDVGVLEDMHVTYDGHVTHDSHVTHDGRKTETIDDIVPKQNVERFLSKLSPAVIKGGKVINIRDGLRERLAGDTSKNEVIVIETEAVKEMKTRVNSASRSRPSTASSVTTLRIKSQAGDQTYMLKMKYSDTIQDVRNHIDKIRNSSEGSLYNLKTSFPNQTYMDVQVSLKDYGLVPNATLYIVKS